MPVLYSCKANYLSTTTRSRCTKLEVVRSWSGLQKTQGNAKLPLDCDRHVHSDRRGSHWILSFPQHSHRFRYPETPADLPNKDEKIAAARGAGGGVALWVRGSTGVFRFLVYLYYCYYYYYYWWLLLLDVFPFWLGA